MSEIEFFSSLRQLSRIEQSVVTIGAFDGVHLGHQQLLRQLVASAREFALPSVVIIFEPQPNEYFNRQLAPARLMRLREKVAALSIYGVDRVVCLKFDRNLSSLSAQSFIESVLVEGLGVKKLIVGDDFRFGSDRRGDFNLLLEQGRQLGFEVVDTKTYEAGKIRVSSTLVRRLLREAKLSEAGRLLGRTYCNLGRVIYGRRLGRELGFPTMNVQLGRLHVPVKGVFAVDVEIEGARYQGVANVGLRPTVNEDMKPLLEVHVFDAELNAYGKFIKVMYRHKIRNEQRFENTDALKAQIEIDVCEARAYFRQREQTN